MEGLRAPEMGVIIAEIMQAKLCGVLSSSGDSGTAASSEG